jgi:hypothetical protein
MEILAKVELGEIGEVVPNDDARSCFTVRVRDSLLVLDANLTTVRPLARRIADGT